MSKTLILLIIVAIIGCGRSNTNDKQEVRVDQEGRVAMGDLVEAPESESRGRAALLPTTPSESVRHILGRIALPESQPFSDDREYLPEPAVEWVVDIRFKGDPRLNPDAIAGTLDAAWRKSFGAYTAYGRDVKSGRWTFLTSADGPTAVDQLKLAFDYLDSLDDDAPLAEERAYAQRLQELSDRMQRFGTPTVAASVPPADAAKRSRLLHTVKRDLDVTAVLALKAPQGKRFDGKKVWDVMLCLGLEWGDMDCFHWRNETGIGDDYFFSVQTSTAPAYFLPEEVAADRVHVDDLVFVFSVPRCAKPVEVFDAMARGVEYARSRLGGEILVNDGVDLQTLRLRIVDVTERLRRAGFEPGADTTLRLF